MRRVLVLLAAAITAVLGSQHIFSIDDDILAFPQYEVIFSDTFIPEEDAETHLKAPESTSSVRFKSSHSGASEATESSPHNVELTKRAAYEASSSSDIDGTTETQIPPEIYESMILDGRRYLCTIPVLEIPARNETAEAIARAEEEEELTLAMHRGSELLNDMDGQCLYHTSDWWSYRFCYNGRVTQFHRLPPKHGVPPFPPLVDPTVATYTLGQARKPASSTSDGASDEGGSDGDVDGDSSNGLSNFEGGVAGQNRPRPDSTELQTKGDVRYLVQRFGHGTVCDLTGRNRKIEIQYHCQPNAPDRIGWIKEISTCSYLMVVHTSRLCDDVAFLPPQPNKAHSIACREIVKPADVEEWKARTKMDEVGRRLLQSLSRKTETDDNPEDSNEDATAAPAARPTLGGVPVGARQHVGNTPSRRIKGGAAVGGDGPITIVAKSRGKSKNGGKVEKLSDEQLRRLRVDPQSVEAWIKEVEEQAEGNGWTLQIMKVAGGDHAVQGFVELDSKDEADGSTPRDDETEDDDGSDEVYQEEL